LFLRSPIVPLVNPDYASPASAQVIQHRLGDFEAHAEALKPCCQRSAKIMQPPAGNTGCAVERRLCFRPSAKGRSTLAGEDKRPVRSPWRGLDICWPVGREGVEKLACWLA
jgi:hypothetical protein